MNKRKKKRDRDIEREKKNVIVREEKTDSIYRELHGRYKVYSVRIYTRLVENASDNEVP